MIENIEQFEADVARATSTEGGNDELIRMAASFMESCMMVHRIPADFDGLALNVLRDPDTHALTAVIITPVDLVNDELKPRFDPETKVRTLAKPRIVLAS